MSPARLTVRAIVVTDGRSSHLPAVVAAVAGQSHRPDAVHLVVPPGLEPPELPGDVAWDVIEHEGGYSEAVAHVLDVHPAEHDEYLWLLHDDSAPLDDALARQVAAAKRRTAAALIGAAQVRWDDVSRLVSVGLTVTRSGARRIELVDEDDINQGQYDERDDVLAVSLAGALVRRDAWAQVGGLERVYRGYGDSLHLSRQAWRAGFDVVVEPRARVRHAQESLYGTRGDGAPDRRRTYALRRAGEWTHALSWARLPMVPVLVVWAFLSAAVRSVLRIAQNEPRLAAADLGVPWRVLARLAMLPGVRARIRRRSTRSRAVVQPFLVGARGAVRYVRAREMRAYDRRRAQEAPSDLVREELAVANARRRGALGALIAVGLAVSVALHGTWLSALAAGRMLTGEALGVTDVPLTTLWERTWSGWSPAGLGAPALDGAFAALLLPAAGLPGGMRVWIGLLLGLGVAIATVSAWFALGAATRSTWVRALGALAYGLWPLHLQAIGDGRVGAVIAHVMLPWFVLGLVRAAGWHRGEAVGDGQEHPPVRLASPSAAMGAAFSLAVVTVAAPVLLLPLVVLVIVAGAFAGASRWRVWAIPLPALVVSGPALVAAWRVGPLSSEAWAILARENGPALASGVVEPWRLALGLTDHSRGIPGLEQLPGTVAVGALGCVLVAAALAAVVSGRAAWAVTAGLTVAAVGVVVAVASQHTVVVQPDGSGQAAANGFAGPGSSLVVAGLLAAVAAASSRSWDAGEGRARAARRLAGSLAIVAVAGVIAATVVIEAWPDRGERGDVGPADTTVLPLVATLEQAQATHARVLLLSDADAGVDYALLEGDGTQLLPGRAERDADGAPWARPGTSVPAASELEPAIAALAGGGSDTTEEFAQWGVGIVVAAPGSSEAVSALSQNAGLSLIGASDYGTVFRIARIAQAEPVSRAWIETPDAAVVTLDSDTFSGTTDAAAGGRLIVAAAADPAWRATADGVALAPVEDPLGRQAFEVPDGASEVAYEYRDGDYRWWWWASVVAVGWAMIGMIPLHDRRIRAVRR